MITETVLIQKHNSEIGNICIECGLCCDGSMFNKARMDKQDDPAFLKQMGVESFTVDDKPFFQLPCRAQKGKRCSLYHDERRFKVCRTFNCKLLKQYLSAEISSPAALDIIMEVRMRRERIKAFSEMLHADLNVCDPSIISFLRELYRSGKVEDPAFRRSYGKQVLDCYIFRELLRQRFYNKKANVNLELGTDDQTIEPGNQTV